MVPNLKPFPESTLIYYQLQWKEMKRNLNLSIYIPAPSPLPDEIAIENIGIVLAIFIESQ